MTQGNADEDGQRGVIINTASVAAYEGQVRSVTFLEFAKVSGWELAFGTRKMRAVP